MAEVTTVEACFSPRGLDSEAWVTTVGAQPNGTSPTVRYADRAEGLTMSQRLAQLEFSDDEDEDNSKRSVDGSRSARRTSSPSAQSPTRVPNSLSLIPMGAVSPKDPLISVKRPLLKQADASVAIAADNHSPRGFELQADAAAECGVHDVAGRVAEETVTTSVEACLSTRGAELQDGGDELALRSMSEEALTEDHPPEPSPDCMSLRTTTAFAPEAWGCSAGGALDLDALAHARYADKGEGLSLQERLSQLEFSDDEDED